MRLLLFCADSFAASGRNSKIHDVPNLNSPSFPPHIQEFAGSVPLTELEYGHFYRLPQRALTIGQVITRATIFPDFNAIEAIICNQLTPFADNTRGLIYEPRISKTRVADKLRPKDFIGNLMNGYAAILPFSADVAALSSKYIKKQVDERRLDDDRQGYRVLFGGDLKADGNIASFMRTVSYFRRFSDAQREQDAGTYKQALVQREKTDGALTRLVQRAPELQWQPIVPDATRRRLRPITGMRDTQ